MFDVLNYAWRPLPLLLPIRLKLLLPLLLAISVSCSGPVPAFGDTFKLGVQEAETYKQAEIVSSPEPVITAELKEECLTTYCEARFNIDVKGRITVHLITSSGSPEVDEITLSTLRDWKFRPALRGTEPVPSTRKIRVEFVVD